MFVLLCENMYTYRMDSQTKNASEQKKTVPQSLHLRILNDVQGKIVSGVWAPGFRIPFETDMAKDYGCSRMTVNKALTQLTRAGLLERSRKSGTFVKAPQSLSAALEITNIRDEVEKAGRKYSYQLLSDSSDDRQPAFLNHLGAAAFCNIRKIKCLHFADDKPFCIEERIISKTAVPEVVSASFEQEAPGTWLFKTVPWNAAEHQIFASAAKGDVASLLKIPQGSACLVVERITQNEKGYVTWARLSYPGDQHRLFAKFTPAG